MKNICVFCGSSDEVAPVFFAAARQLGATLAQQGLQLIYGGGKTGLMGAVADAVLAHGGQVVGVITAGMNTPALAHSGLTRLEVAPNLLERKQRMMALADAFIALPGGFGTLDELFEVLTGLQIRQHSKPIGLLEVDGFYQPLLQALDAMTRARFIPSAHRAMLQTATSPQALLARLQAFSYPEASVQTWLREN